MNEQRARLALLAKAQMAQRQSGGMNSMFPMAMMMGNDNVLPMMMMSQMMRGGGGLGPGYGMDTHGGLGASIPSTSGTSNDLFLKYVKLILARIQRLERQQQQSKKQSSGGIHGSHLHGGTGNSNEMLRYVQVILARLANLEKQQAQQNTQSNNGLFGGNSGLSNYILYESLF
ncbi:unnamed protein product [Mytilus edulis]|uniref:Uncharacterized protein n=1 Tax=Mytilus edulis TaxID=6550 RepID=A0A8S3QJG9_MYTED|nr:unnamed protein product [Mytilus edulis]